MKRILKIENIALALIILFVTLFVYFVEYNWKKEAYVNEKIYDLELQYKARLVSNKELVHFMLAEILEDENALRLLYEADKNIDKDKNRAKLFEMYSTKYELMKEHGVLQFHFHLANGKSFLRFHKPEKYGDNLLNIRETIKKVIETKKYIYGFDIGKHFEGFRYMYPLFYKGEYVGSVEASISTLQLLKQLTEFLDARYSMILNAKTVDRQIKKEFIKKYYHRCHINNNFYMANSVHNQELFQDSKLNIIKEDIKDSLSQQKSFVKVARKIGTKSKLFVFIAIYDVNNEFSGYIFSVKDDATLDNIFISELVKLIVAILLILLLFYFYKSNMQKTNIIHQLQSAIDQTTLVSKTDKKGIITYANDAFSNLSGYTKEELIGSPHSIVRHADMSKEAFKDMWETIKSKKVWHGTIKNRVKNGESYTVDATIIPILDVNGKISEYIAIRHDITELENYKEILKDRLDKTDKSLKETINYTKQYEIAINNITAVLKTDTNNIITFANKKFCDISGYTLEELIGVNVETLRCEDHIKNGDCADIMCKLTQGETATFVFTNIDKNENSYTIDATIYPVTDLDNKVVEYLHVMHDISEIVELYNEIEETQKEVIFRMGAIGESRSKETGNHVKRVAEYSKLLARLYGLDEPESELLKQASPMHDIGKVGIPDSILKKPGSLDRDEWVIMQTHSELGYEMLKHSNRPILQAAAIVANEHHEKWNGSGYPRGLKGEDIHIYGRITAIADVFDALGSDRVYKKAWELEKILDLFKEENGKHFEPRLVELFLDNIDKFLVIRDSFKD